MIAPTNTAPAADAIAGFDNFIACPHSDLRSTRTSPHPDSERGAILMSQALGTFMAAARLLTPLARRFNCGPRARPAGLPLAARDRRSDVLLARRIGRVRPVLQHVAGLAFEHRTDAGKRVEASAPDLAG